MMHFHSELDQIKTPNLDPKVGPLTGYEPQDLIERTLYQYVHADDMNGIRASHITCKCTLGEEPLENVFSNVLADGSVNLYQIR